MPRLHSPLWPNRSIKPPYGAVEIDGGHPLAMGLQHCIMFGGPAWNLAPDLCGGAPMTMTTASGAVIPSVGTARGQAMLVDGLRPIGSKPSRVTGTPASLVVLGRIGAGDNGSGGRPALAITGGTNPPTLSWTSTNTAYYYQGGEGVALAIFAATDIPSAIVATSHPSSRYLWARGQQGDYGGFNAGSGWTTLSIVDKEYASYFAQIYGLVYNINLTRDLANWLDADPYCFLRPVIRRSYGFVGAAAPGGRTTKNTRPFPLGVRLGMSRGISL